MVVAVVVWVEGEEELHKSRKPHHQHPPSARRNGRHASRKPHHQPVEASPAQLNASPAVRPASLVHWPRVLPPQQGAPSSIFRDHEAEARIKGEVVSGGSEAKPSVERPLKGFP